MRYEFTDQNWIAIKPMLSLIMAHGSAALALAARSKANKP